MQYSHKSNLISYEKKWLFRDSFVGKKFMPRDFLDENKQVPCDLQCREDSKPRCFRAQPRVLQIGEERGSKVNGFCTESCPFSSFRRLFLLVYSGLPGSELYKVITSLGSRVRVSDYLRRSGFWNRYSVHTEIWFLRSYKDYSIP